MSWKKILKEEESSFKYSYNDMKAVFDEAANSVNRMNTNKYIKSGLLSRISSFWMRVKEVGNASVSYRLDRNIPRYSEFVMEQVKKNLDEMLGE